LGTITYDQPTNVIWVSNFTEEVPCTLDDLYQADQGGGWGVISRLNAWHYHITARIRLSTNGWFADSGKLITYATTTQLFRGYNGHLTLGELVDESSKTTKNGCTILDVDATRQSWPIRFDQPGRCYLYGCTFGVGDETYRRYVRPQKANPTRIWNCLFIGRTELYGTPANADVWNVTSMNAYSAFYNLQGTIDKITALDATRGLEFFGGTLYTVSNAVLRNCTYAIGIGSCDADIYIINLDPGSGGWTFAGGMWGATIYRQYTVNMKVVDSSGTVINGATVTLYDKDDNEIFSVSMDAQGEIAEQTVSRGKYERSFVLQDFSPHKLEVSKTGYITLTLEGITLEKTDWLLQLLTIGEATVDQLPFTVEVESPSLDVGVEDVTITVEVDE
jgi:hypothetical protein